MGFLDNKRRKKNYRQDISGTERAIGWVIVFVLVGIAVTVFVKGQHYDASLFALDASLLESTSEAAATVQSTDTTEEDSIIQGPIGVLPPELPGWSLMGAVEFFIPTNLYEKINGRAEQYLAYDCIGLETASLVYDENADLFLDIFIYDMRNTTNAFGIFSAERSPGDAIEVGDEGYMSGASLFFRKGQYYNQVLAVDETPEVRAALDTAAEWISQRQSPAAGEFSVFDIFPKENQVPDSAQYAKVDGLGLSFMSDVYIVTYEQEGVEIPAFVTRRGSVTEAQQLLEEYRGCLSTYGALLPPLESDDITLTRGDMGGFYDVVFQKGEYLGGVNFVADQTLAEEMATRLAENLP